MIVLFNNFKMASDPHIQIKHRCDEIISEARKNAIEQDKQDIQDLNLEKLSAEEQIWKLISEKQAVKQKADRLEKKEYYRLDRYDHLISILYLSRLVCLNQDDEQAIRDGILINVKEQHIDLLLSKAKEHIKPFTFDDFISNQCNIVFYDLDEKPGTTSDEDYERIRSWQTNKKISCIKLEFNKFRENFKKAVKDEIIIHDSLLDEIKQVRNILNDGAIWKEKQFHDELIKLKGLADIILPEDIIRMHQEFCLFLKGNNFKSRLSPRFFETTMKNIEAGRISELPIFGLSLSMYFRWLLHVSMFKKVAFHRAEFSFDTLFANTMKEGEDKKDNAINSVKKKAMDRSYNDLHYERFIVKGMEEQRKLFNKLEYPHYFKFLEQKELLKNCFIEDCLRSLDIEKPKEALRQTIIMNENIQFYCEELCLLKQNPLIPSADQLSEITLMTVTLCHMAPGSELINLFLDTREMIKKQVYNERIPLFFICENADGLFTEIFEKAVMNFKKLVEDLPIEDKGRFISEMLREINYMETLNGFKCRKKNIFLKQFKHILKDELKIAHEMQSFHPAEYKEYSNKKERTLNKPFNFGYRKGPKELKPILTAMDLKMGMLANGSTVDDLMDVFTCPDLSKNTKTIYIGFTIIKFAYFRKKVEQWFSSFTAANIERSGIFISSTEGPIKAHVLYNSTAILWEDSHLIDSIFDAKY